MSAAVLSGLEPIAAAAAGGGEPIAATAAGERVQQLQALLEQVEQGPSMVASKTFASALDAAKAGSASPATAGVSGGGSTYAPMIEQAAARYGIDPSVLYGLIEQESGFDPSATSSAGAQGLTQLMPSTAASLGVAEPLDPAQSIEGGARYLSGLLRQFGGNTADALAAYNAGPGAVEQYGGVPPYPETQQYVTKVLGYAASYSQSGQDAGALPYPTSTATGSTATAAAVTAPTATPSEAIV
jgi:soluble lytic murein transglycosylase-like protein